jgi:hypothetical protein
VASLRWVLLHRIGKGLPRNEQIFAVFEAIRSTSAGSVEPVIVAVTSTATWVFTDGKPCELLERWSYPQGTKPFGDPVNGRFELHGQHFVVEWPWSRSISNALYVRAPIDPDEGSGEGPTAP